MSTDITWIIRALQSDPTKTRAGMARALNIDKSAITRLLAGERQLKFHEASKIAAYLEITPPLSEAIRRDGASEKDHSYGDGGTVDGAPIYDAEAISDGSWMLFRNMPSIDRKQRAPHFENAAKVFGFYAPDDVMAPRFKTGEIVWIDPARPPVIGGDVLLVDKDAGPDGEKVILGELNYSNEERWVIIQHSASSPDKREQTFEADTWSACFVLPRY